MCQCAENIRLFVVSVKWRKFKWRLTSNWLTSLILTLIIITFFSLCILQEKNLNYNLMEHHSSSSALILLNIQSVKLGECYFTLKDHYRGKHLRWLNEVYFTSIASSLIVEMQTRASKYTKCWTEILPIN